MSYDMHGAFDMGKPAYFQAPWKMNPDNPYIKTGYEIETVINDYIKSGITPKSLVVGIPLYARTMKLNQLGDKFGLYETVTGTGFGQFEDGIFDYKCLVNSAECIIAPE